MSATMRLLDAAAAIGGEVVGAACEERSFSGVSTDTRTLGAGELFVALRGERFDGNDYVGTAEERGAAAALVASDAVRKLSAPGGMNLPLIAVDDTRDALGRLAAYWRARFSIPVVAVTGSNGKTTTKEMIAAILRAVWGGAVHATEGNLNNEIGLPLTLLGLDATHRAAVVEVGMSHPGEVLELARIAQASVALVTNAQRAHLEGLGSLEAVAAEKGALYAGMPESGIAVINADDAFYELWLGLASGRKLVRFSFERPVEVCARRAGDASIASESILTLRFGGEEVEVRLMTPGIHNARNALGAAAAALAAGAPLHAVRDGLSAFRGVRRRLTRRRALRGATVYDDTYNANPDSVRAGIDVLASTDGKKILVFGDMGEVGDDGARLHEEVGAYAREKGIDLLFALGASSARALRGFGGDGRHFDDADALIAALKTELSPRVTVLVKGSRFMRMERVADAVAAPETGSESESGGI
ncbi:MAG: UDP-N-acetylmuramoyl-tripeptide--D-alanyl-D-alanine ligase [Candidatus Accumulibacter sp.]|jgi:UDP-N-acetylmuramoyl-tripeptide--D-alanyl-D-alanine ligase|nr:UDP-N-acetylmuramoyl-tripeptide--D-alanyl-D-alanine ligase [Accumulibacter sp.]